MYVNSLLNGQEEHTAAIDPESGTATLRFEQYGYGHGLCFVRPGIRDVLDCPR